MSERIKRFFLRKAEVSKAIRYAYQDNSLTARPISWRNSGYGLVTHGGFIYRIHGQSEMSAYQIPAAELMEHWEVVRRSQLQEELDGTFKAAREKKRIFGRPDGTRRSGRPSKQEVTAIFEGMLCIDDASAQAGVASHSLRRAILANKLPWMKQHGVYLVSLDEVKKWRDGSRGPRQKKEVEQQEVVYY